MNFTLCVFLVYNDNGFVQTLCTVSALCKVFAQTHCNYKSTIHKGWNSFHKWSKLPTYFDDITTIENNPQVRMNIDATLVAIFCIDMSTNIAKKLICQRHMFYKKEVLGTILKQGNVFTVLRNCELIGKVLVDTTMVRWKINLHSKG